MNYQRYRYEEDNHQKPQTLRPVLEPNELAHAITLTIIPNQLTIAIVDPGQGATPTIGEFVRVKQFIYTEDLKIIRQERFTYIFGRKKTLEGLQYCLALCREGFRGRIYLNERLGYGNESFGPIPAKTNLIFDIEVNNITLEPINNSAQQDELLIQEIMLRAKEGEALMKKGKHSLGKRELLYAFERIQSLRCKQIKGYLYNNQRANALVICRQKTFAQLEKQKNWLALLLDAFDNIKIKTIQALLINKDYYNVLIYSKNCMVFGNKLELNPRILLARAISLLQIGEFKNAMGIFTHLRNLYPAQAIYEHHLARAETKYEKCKKMIDQIGLQPVLPMTQKNKNRKYEIIRVGGNKLGQQDDQMKKLRQASKEGFLIDTNMYDDNIE